MSKYLWVNDPDTISLSFTIFNGFDIYLQSRKEIDFNVSVMALLVFSECTFGVSKSYFEPWNVDCQATMRTFGLLSKGRIFFI